MFVLTIFFWKQKTAYELRMSDLSSDVCSSDLTKPMPHHHTSPPDVRERDNRKRAGRQSPIAAPLGEIVRQAAQPRRCCRIHRASRPSAMLAERPIQNLRHEPTWPIPMLLQETVVQSLSCPAPSMSVRQMP